MRRLLLFSCLGATIMLASCGQQTDNASQPSSQKVTGISEFEYLACDGGPHLVLPKELSQKWKVTSSLLGALTLSGDYGRACTATATQKMALIPVGGGQAMVLANPPLSAWGHSPEGWIDIYLLEAWADTNTDALLKRAVAATPTDAMTDSGKVMTLTESGLVLLFAGDKPGSAVYGEYPIPIEPGSYRILEGYYKGGTNEEIYVYRLRPKRT